jgi:hypothetical protein
VCGRQAELEARASPALALRHAQPDPQLVTRCVRVRASWPPCARGLRKLPKLRSISACWRRPPGARNLPRSPSMHKTPTNRYPCLSGFPARWSMLPFPLNAGAPGARLMSPSPP